MPATARTSTKLLFTKGNNSTSKCLSIKNDPNNNDSNSSTSTLNSSDGTGSTEATSNGKLTASERATSILFGGKVNNSISASLANYSVSDLNRVVTTSLHVAKKWSTKGYNPFKPDQLGFTALHRAANKGDVGMLESLLSSYEGDKLALLALKTVKHQQNVLHLACKMGHVDAAKIIINCHLPVEILDAQDKFGNTALHFLVAKSRKSYLPCIKLLLVKGANAKIPNARSLTPLAVHVLTSSDSNYNITSLLIRYDANPNDLTHTAEQNTVLHVAVSRGLWQIAEELVCGGADMNTMNGKHQMVVEMLSRKEFMVLARHISQEPTWISKGMRPKCMVCHKKFSLMRRSHHCRMCGRICCGPCSKYKRKLIYEDYTQTVANSVLHKVCSWCSDVRLKQQKQPNNYEDFDLPVASP